AEIAIDDQEIPKISHRVRSFFSVLVRIHYQGSGTLEVDPGDASLEFVRHENVIQSSLDPEHLALRTQDLADQVEFDTEKEIKKHPGKKEERERFLQIYKKEIADFQDFLSRQTLSQTQLDSSNNEVTGWVLFSTHGKWLGDWKNPEAFVFRIPLGGKVLE